MTEKQTEKILKYMQEHGSITPLEALEEAGCMRLAARISDLRHDGYNIITERAKRGDKNFARYRLMS